MAAKFPDFYGELDELLACSVCLERCNQAKSLPCMHAFCLECLQQLIDKAGIARNINCPSCRTEVPIPTGGADAFPAAFLWNAIGETIDKFKQLGLHDKPKCSTCLKKGKQIIASSLCIDCMITLCTDCLSTHDDFTSDHNVMACTNLQSGGLNDILTSKTDKCSKHNKNLEMYCVSCRELICMVCGMVEHGPHKKQALDTVMQGHKGDLQNYLDQLTKREDHYQKFIDETDQAELDCKASTTSKRHAVEEHGTKAIQMMQEFIKQTVTEIETEGTKSVSQIRSLRQNLTQEKYHLSTTRKHIEASIHFANSTTIINTSDTDRQRYDVILRELQPQHSLPKLNLNLKLADLQLFTRNNLIGTIKFTTSKEPLGQAGTIPMPLSPSKPGKLVTRKVREFAVPYQPRGVACSPGGNIAVCEAGESQASVHRPDGHTLTKLNTPSGTITGDIEYADNKILVADVKTKSVLEFDDKGSFIRSIHVDLGGTVDGGFSVQDKKLYVTNYNEGKVHHYDWPSGHNKAVFMQKTPNDDLSCPVFIATDTDHVAVSCYESKGVYLFNKAGSLLFSYTGEGSKAGKLDGPIGVIIDAEHRVLVNDFKKNMIHIVSNEGQYLGEIDTAKDGLDRPVGLALDNQGLLLVAAYTSKKIVTYEYTFQ